MLGCTVLPVYISYVDRFLFAYGTIFYMTTKRERAHQDDLELDEEPEVIFVERQFPIVLRWPLIWGLVIILVGLLPWSLATGNDYSWQPQSVIWLGIVSIFLVLYWGYHYIGWYFTVLILTDQDITFIKQHGLFQRDVQSLTLNNIQSVNYKIPGFQAAIFKFGDLRIDTLSGSGRMVIKLLHRPADIQSAILIAMQGAPSTDKASMVYDSGDNTEGE